MTTMEPADAEGVARPATSKASPARRLPGSFGAAGSLTGREPRWEALLDLRGAGSEAASQECRSMHNTQGVAVLQRMGPA